MPSRWEKSLQPLDELARRLWAFEERAVTHAPGVELTTLPAARQMLVDDRKCAPELMTAQQVRVEAATAVAVWPEDATAKQSLNVLQRLHVAAMRLQLE